MNVERFHELMADNQTAHSDLQIDRFIILANGLTEYGCYKQALRELHIRFHAMLGYWLELESLAIDEAEAAEKTLTRRQQLELAKIRLQIAGIREHFAESKREFLRFLAHADTLKARVGELTPERRNQLEREFWIENIRRMGPQKAAHLAAVLPDEDRQALEHEAPRQLPEWKLAAADLDIERLMTLTVDRLLPQK